MKAFLSLLTCIGLLPGAMAIEPVSKSSDGSISLLPAEPGAGGGRVAGATVAAEVSFGDAVSGGVSNITSGNVVAKGGYTSQLYDARALALGSQSGGNVTAGDSLQLIATITLDDDTMLVTSALQWEAVDGPIAGIDGIGLLSAGYPNTSSTAEVRGTFDLLSDTFPFTIDPLPKDPYTFTFSELGGTGPYQILFGDSTNSLVSTTTSDQTYDPGTLVRGQSYYWQIFDSSGANFTPGGGGPVRLLAGPDLELLKIEDGANPANTDGFGAVARPYWMGSFEVTNEQYSEFLNAVAGTDLNNLYDVRMGNDAVGGITRFGNAGDYTYAPRDKMADKPVNFVTFWSACRYCNWLHNELPNGAQTAATTEDGAYDLTDSSALASNTVTRKTGALYHLPDQDEWDKAAFYDPRIEAQMGPVGDHHYWLYPTVSDMPPTPATADSDGNIDNDTDPIANYGNSADWNGQDGNVTTVGSGGIGSRSYFGVSDMAGNVREMLEEAEGSNRFVRGGDYTSLSTALASTDSAANRLFLPTSSAANTGFRVVAYEPPVVVTPPPAANPNAPLIASIKNKLKKLKKQFKKAKKTRNSGKAKKIKRQIKSFKKKLRAL